MQHTVISAIREHITIFQTLSIDIWQQNMANFFSANFSELSKFSCSSFQGKPLWNQKLLLLTATAWFCCYKLIRPVPTLSFFHSSTNFFGINFRRQNKNIVIATISYFDDQLLKKYCIYYVSEHLKYCS